MAPAPWSLTPDNGGRKYLPSVRKLIDFRPLILSALTSALLTPVAGSLAASAGMCSVPRPDRWGDRPTPLLGGLAILGAVTSGMCVFPPCAPVEPLLCGAWSAFILGLADDLFALGPRDKLLGVGACFAVEHLVTQAFIPARESVQTDGLSRAGALPAVDKAQWLSLVFCLAGTNAVNLSDNMDGLAAGLAGVSAGSIVGLLDKPQQESPALALLGSCLGYLVWNAPPARVFMGDAGSMGLGYLLSRLAYEAPRAGFSAQIDPAGGAVLSVRARASVLLISVLLLAVPATDSLATLARRIVEQRPIFRGSTDHLSHTLARQGLREPGSALVLQCAQAAAGMVAIGVGRRLRSRLPDASGHSAPHIDRGMWPAIAAAGVAGALIMGCWFRGRCR